MEAVDKNIEKIVFFDGLCNFCDASVNFILDHNSKKDIFFASLQSELGQKLMLENKLDPENLSTLIFQDQGKIYTKSKAALRIARYLDSPLDQLSLFSIVPSAISDQVYDYIAKNRYKFFGKKEACRIPTPETRSRFIS